MRSGRTWTVGALLAGTALGVALSAIAAPGRTGELGIRPGLDASGERLLTLLRVREKALERREATVAAREAELRAFEEELQQRLERLQALREELRGQLRELDERQEQEVRGLVKMFEGMRPAQAAAVLERTDEEVAIEVLRRMNKLRAGRALGAMSPDRAARLAERLGRPRIDVEAP